MNESRRVSAVVPSIRVEEGGGFVVHRTFPVPGLSHIDPFLLLDEMGPAEYAPGQAKGAPDHPHRGFETVTYLLSGEMEHRDSAGNAGRLGPGDVQWMTAGKGVIHSEMPSEAFQGSGGRMHGFQLWVNLPAAEKMMAPRYQEIPAPRIPTYRSEDGRVKVKVIAGDVEGVRSVIDTRTPIFYLHAELEPGSRFRQPVPAGYVALAYVIEGEGWFGPEGSDGRTARRTDLVVFDAEGGAIELRSPKSERLSALLLGGMPLREPVARYGPFVMNTAEEIRVAISDYQDGRLA